MLTWQEKKMQFQVESLSSDLFILITGILFYVLPGRYFPSIKLLEVYKRKIKT